MNASRIAAAFLFALALLPAASLGGEAPPAPKSLEQWIADLASPDAAARLEAARAIAAFGPGAVQAAPALIRLFEDRDTAVYQAAIEALVRIGTRGLPEACCGLSHADGAVRRGAGYAIWRIVEALPVDTDPVEKWVGLRIEDVAPEIWAAGAPLAGALKDGDPYVGRIAAMGLGRIFAHVRRVRWDFDKFDSERFAIDVGANDVGHPFPEGARRVLEERARRAGCAWRLRPLDSRLVRLEGEGPGALQDALDAILRALALVPDSDLVCLKADIGWIEAGSRLAGARTVRSAVASMAREAAARRPLKGASGIRATAKDAVAGIEDALSDAGLAKAALRLLAALNVEAAPAVPAIVGLLKAGEPEMRMLAAWALRQMGPCAAPAEPALVEIYLNRGEDAALRAGAMNILACLQARSAAALEAYRAGLSDPSENVRKDAATALKSMGPAAAPAAPELLAALDDASEAVRAYAEFALKAIGPAAAPVLMGILQRTPPAPPELERRVIGWIGRSGVAASAAEPLLVARLEGDDLATCEAAAAALVSVRGGNVEDLAAGLFKELVSDVPAVRERAETGLGPMAFSIVAALVETLADERPAVRCAAARLLGKAGQRAASAQGNLIRALQDPDAEARAAAAFALARVARRHPDTTLAIDGKAYPHHREAILALAGALGDKTPGVRDAAGKGLALIGHEADGTYMSMRGDPDPAVRKAVAQAMGEIGSRNQWMWDGPVQFARPLLGDGDAGVRAAAAEALGKMGSHAKPAVPALSALANDENPEVREAAKAALERIGK